MRSMGDFDRALRIAAISAALAAAFVVLIAGIFVTDFDTSTEMLVGLGVVLAALWVLLLTIVARFAFRTNAPAKHSTDGNKFHLAVIACSVSAAALLFCTWHEVRICMQKPAYQEAAIAPAIPSSF